MIWLIFGVVLWTGVHFIPSLARERRADLIARVGEGPYKAAFSVTIILSIVLMVVGYGAADATLWWVAPDWLRLIVIFLMWGAFILFFCGRAPNNVRRYIRHPQLTGVKLWAALHLIMNGDLPSLVLFGGLLAWAVAQVILINRREGPYAPPHPLPFTKALVAPAVGTLVWLLFMGGLHAWLFGVSPL